MRFTEEMKNTINEAYKTKADGLHLNVDNSGHRGGVVYNGQWMICEVVELDQMIAELMKLRETITDETGVLF